MYRVEDICNLRWYRNVHDIVIKELASSYHGKLTSLSDVYDKIWKDEYNITLEGTTFDIDAIFESEEDFICFKLKWN